MTKLSLSAALFGLFASPSALACGGLFCNQSQPVVQAAERIAFAIDSEQQVVEAHVQIFYEGPADEFAWVVPVSSNPDIFLSTDQLFNVLALQLAPLFTLNTIEEGNCDNVRIAPFENVVSNLSVADTGMVLSGSYDDTVDVIQEGQVGPYDMVVLQADQADGLMDWLVENGYDLPPGIEPVLNPYVAEDAHFLALKLSKDRDAGDIAPIGFRYAGTQPAVPIQLTSIAAAPDMRLEAYVFADERVVPESYLHVQINEAAIDWWQGGINYNDVITKAANEAGGHAFGTDYAGPPGFLRGRVWNGDFDVTEQQQIQNFSEFVDTLRTRGLPSTVNMQDALMTCVTPPNGVDPLDFYNCPDCYDGWDPSAFDPISCTKSVDLLVAQPLRDAENLFDHAWVSRMTSSLSAVEMDVDPVFVMNPDMGQVDNVRSANQVFMCKGGKKWDTATRRLELSDGREILIPSRQWLRDNNTTEFEFIEDLGEINAQIIEETGASGKPSVLTDLTGILFDQTDAHNRGVMDLLGCGGCSASGALPAGGAWVLAMGLLVMNRRRSARISPHE